MAGKRSVLVVAVAALVPALAVVAFLAWWFLPPEDLSAWRDGPPPHAWAAWQRQEDRWREEGSHRQIEHRYVPLAAISLDLQLAVLVGEDINFFGHGPVDLRELWEVFLERRPGARLRGASTVSQQLARSLFLSQERTVWRKLNEARLAWWLERRLGKHRILELYLNVVEFGPGLLGAEAASQHYFGLPAITLEGEDAAGLAAAIPAPGRDNPATASKRWQFRRTTIVSRMARAEWLHGLLCAFSKSGQG